MGKRRSMWLGTVVTLGWLATAWAAVPATQPAGRPGDFGPDVVLLNDLVNQYEPVPFEHARHARMAQMREGCLTCHHRRPQPGATTAPANLPLAQPGQVVSQAQAAETPACKSCHPIESENASIDMPSLKGAYHRQCLNCHRDWMGANACDICHKRRTAATAKAAAPTPGDIVGRMHPPIPQPSDQIYRARYTPADGTLVLFRHKEHTQVYGIKCATCHYQDSCADCHHRKDADNPGPRPVQPAQTWQGSHGPCFTCHGQDRCSHCHYHRSKTPPPVFAHASTGQALDRDHAHLGCQQCHVNLAALAQVSCGHQSCHAGKVMTYPAKRPGKLVPKPVPPAQPKAQSPVPDKPTLLRIRR